MRSRYLAIALLVVWLGSHATRLYADLTMGMTRDEVMRQYSREIVNMSPTGELTLATRFWGHKAKIYVGFEGDEIFMLEVRFAFDESPTAGQISVFSDVRRRLQRIKGREYIYVRVNGISLLGESAGSQTRTKPNAVGFHTVSDNVVYSLVMFSNTPEAFAVSPEVELTIVPEKAVAPPY